MMILIFIHKIQNPKIQLNILNFKHSNFLIFKKLSSTFLLLFCFRSDHAAYY